MALFTENSCRPAADGISFRWHELPPLPPSPGETEQPGVAGPLAGAHGNRLLVAGGANFAGGLPWRGGTKIYHDEIFLLEKNGPENYFWKQAEEKLPFPLAYPVCLSLAQGVVSIGGENEQGPLNDVLLLTFAGQTVNIEWLPPLPLPLSAAGAAAIDSTLFVAGGSDQTGASSAFLTLDLQNRTLGWQKLPDLPEALSHAVVVSQHDGKERCVYVLGGRNKTSEISTFLSSVWKYTPSAKTWTMESQITEAGQPSARSAGTGIAAGNNLIALFGGDPGIFFNRTEQLNNAIAAATSDAERQKLLLEKDSMLTSHPGFSHTVLLYNTVTKTWTTAGSLPEHPPVTTTAFYWDNQVIIPSGEIRPGVRTPKIMGAEISTAK